MIRFYYGSGSPFSWRVQLALEEKGLAYEPVLLSFEKGEHKSPAHLARSPHGKVPALEDDGVSLYESSAIVEYLEERYPRTPLLPPDPAARAAVRIEELECLLYFTERFFPLARHVFFTPPDKRDPAAIEAARAEVRGQLGQLEARAALTHDLVLAVVGRGEPGVEERRDPQEAQGQEGGEGESMPAQRPRLEERRLGQGDFRISDA